MQHRFQEDGNSRAKRQMGMGAQTQGNRYAGGDARGGSRNQVIRQGHHQEDM
jgi:hypothetical protein